MKDFSKDGTKEAENLLKGEDYKVFLFNNFIVLNDDNTVINIHSNYNKDDKVTKVYFKTIKEKFANLNMTYDQLYEFYSKLINKTNFYHNNMTFFNFRQITLENKKDIYSHKVNAILSKNYQNFEDLVKNNSRFANFMQTYGSKKIKLYKQPDIIPKFPNHFTEFYEKCEHLFIYIKIFLESIINK